MSGTSRDNDDWTGPHRSLLAAGGEAAADEQQVREVLIAGASYYDHKDIGALVELYTADAEYISFLGSCHGQNAIRERYDEMVAHYDRTAHLLSSVVVRFDGLHQARTASYLHAIVQLRSGASYAFIGSYDDVLIRTSDGWRIARRIVRDGPAYSIAAIEPTSRISLPAGTP